MSNLRDVAAQYWHACETLERTRSVVNPEIQKQKVEAERLMIEQLKSTNQQFFALSPQGPWLELERRAPDMNVMDANVLATLYANFFSDQEIVTQINAMQTQKERGDAFELYVRRAVEGRGAEKWGLKKHKTEPTALKLQHIAGL
jgi:hypothetical protein